MRIVIQQTLEHLHSPRELRLLYELDIIGPLG
jgi:hypothetical protein